MARLPVPGQDKGTWGYRLNEYLEVSHESDGVLKDGIVGDSKIMGTLSQSKITGLSASLSAKADISTTYTKAEVDTAVGVKANTSSLSAVATSGSYADLTNKPTITSLGGDTRYYQKTETVPVIVLNDGDPVPGGTPNGTVVFYRSV